MQKKPIKIVLSNVLEDMADEWLTQNQAQFGSRVEHTIERHKRRWRKERSRQKINRYISRKRTARRKTDR